MDNQPGDSGFTDDEKIKIGQQQAAMIQLQNAREQQMLLQQEEEKKLMEAQQKALQFKMDQERQQMMRTMEAKQKEEELVRLQQIALMERQKEQQMQMAGQGPPVSQMSGIPQSVPQHMGPPMGHPQQSMAGPHQMGAPQQLRGPPPISGVAPIGAPPQMGAPQQMGVSSQIGGPQQMGCSQSMGMPQQMGGPQPVGVSTMGAPQQMGGSMHMSQAPHMRPQMQMSGPNQQLGGPMPMGNQGQMGNQQNMGRPMGNFQQSSGPQSHGPMGVGPPPRMGDDRMGDGPMMPDGPPRSSGSIPSLMAVQPFSTLQKRQQHGEIRSGPQGNQFDNNRGPDMDRDDGRPPSLLQIETKPTPSLKSDLKDEVERDEDGEFKLPPALEKILAFKDARVQEVGVKPEEMERYDKGELVEEEEEGEAEVTEEAKRTHQQQLEAEDEDEEEPIEQDAKKESKNKKRKKKKKRSKQRHAQQVPSVPQPIEEDEGVEIEYIPEEIEVDRHDPSYREFSKIFEAFKITEPVKENKEEPKEIPKEVPKEKPPKLFGQESSDEDEDSDSEKKKPQEDEDKQKLSKKKQKKLNRLTVAELKQAVQRPDLVEMHDVTSKDPRLLLQLKATRNSVPVPRHWCFKRKYLQGKRGIEKPPFDLPEFIKNTGIMEMRQALQDKEEAKNLKAKMREKVRPKMGKIDIDYQKLHDAFFKYQTKPKMTIHGDLYYEGKEFETKLREKKPGDLTDDLRTALGMPLGKNADKYPPPWLIAMQRYGPPPSYPNLKVPGLNAAIPEGCSFGYHAGGWGKPPVDEMGKPLYGDVFGQSLAELPSAAEEDIDKSLWGELESESEEEETSDEESEEEKDDADASGLVTPGDPGLASVTPSGTTSVPIGVETPDMIELRKKRIEDAMDQGGDTPALYQVLKEKSATVGGAMMGSAHVYDIGGVQAGGKKAEGVEVALNPDELDLDTAAIQAKYDQQMREQQSQLAKEDLSDMVADHAAKQAKKRKKQQQESQKSAKKYKEFKF